MEAAILRGIFGTSNTPVYSCHGSCSWNSSHVTLGFKSACSDVTSATFATRKCDQESGGPTHTCKISTPQGIDLSIDAVLTDDYVSFKLIAVESIAPGLVKFAVYRGAAHESISLSAEQHLEHATITDCLLSLAAYEYPGANSDGSTFTLKESTELEMIFSNKSYIDASGETASRYVYDVTGTDNVTTTELVMGGDDIATMQSYFMSNTISTQWTEGGGLHNTDYGISAALMGNVDLAARFAGMANSMTIYLRSRPDALSLTGYTVVQQVSVHIQWYWLAGPIAMEFAALLLAISTIILNRTNKYPPWKSSTLAMLACSQDEDGKVIWSRVKNIKSIKKSAKKSLVEII
jgi:hypothetical protein